MSVNSKMTAIADEIRELSGATKKLGLDDMANSLSNSNNTVTVQASLISTIKSALNGKAAGDGEGGIIPSGTKTINSNGVHDVTLYEKANVNVPIPDGYIKPNGVKSIIENGVHDATEYESVSVNVPIPDGYIIPEGTKQITENGVHDAKTFESVEVNVSIPDGYVKPEGALSIDKNGDFDVREYASVSVNVGTGGGDGGDPSLPSGYVRCSYIQFNAAQAIDTGIIGNQNTKVKVYYTRENSSSAYLYGCASSDNTAALTAYLGGNWRFGSKSASVSPVVSEEMIHTAIQSKTGVERFVASSAYSGVTAFETIGTLLLGASRNANGSIGTSVYVGKVFLFEIWQGSTLALKLIPVVSTDGIYRFYDEVNGSFFDSIKDTPLSGGNL